MGWMPRSGPCEAVLREHELTAVCLSHCLLAQTSSRDMGQVIKSLGNLFPPLNVRMMVPCYVPYKMTWGSNDKMHSEEFCNMQVSVQDGGGVFKVVGVWYGFCPSRYCS